LKILTAEQIRAADVYTIKHEPIKSIDLMERAGAKCFDWIYDHAPKLFPPSITEESAYVFNVVCGVGNNGGDGLVIARLLQRNGYNVEITVVHFSGKPAPDFEANFAKLGSAKKTVVEVKKAADIPKFASDSVIVDAIFGSGINRPAEGIAADTIDAINGSGAMVVSIDLPSGLYSEDNSKNDFGHVVKANHILTFQTPKLSFFLADTPASGAKLHILDIGLHADYMRDVEVIHHLYTANDAKHHRQTRNKFSHKGTFGHVLLLAGSYGKYGAAALAAKGCLKAGAGLVTSHLSAGGAQAIGMAVPELMLSIDPSPTGISELPKLESFTAIAAGPGMGTSEDATRVLKRIIQEAQVPLVLDADALNILADQKTWMAFLPKGTILTPHPGEFARLIGEKLSHFESIEKQREMSQKYGIYILLKGAHSTLSLPDGQVLINSTGNAGMASAGMGDALTGIIAGLLAGGYSPMKAAALGMYVHGCAGDLALGQESPESLTASDLIAHLGRAFNNIGYADM
jgi:NAD(P)H-hydrate epimerase